MTWGGAKSHRLSKYLDRKPSPVQLDVHWTLVHWTLSGISVPQASMPVCVRSILLLDVDQPLSFQWQLSEGSRRCKAKIAMTFCFLLFRWFYRNKIPRQQQANPDTNGWIFMEWKSVWKVQQPSRWLEPASSQTSEKIYCRLNLGVRGLPCFSFLWFLNN